MNAELKTYKDLDAWKDLGLSTLDVTELLWLYMETVVHLQRMLHCNT